MDDIVDVFSGAGYASCLEIKGSLVKSPGRSQLVEVHADDIKVLGPCDGNVSYIIKIISSSVLFCKTNFYRPRSREIMYLVMPIRLSVRLYVRRLTAKPFDLRP